MARASLSFLIVCLLYIIPLASSQDTTPAPLTITQTFSATVDLWTTSNAAAASATATDVYREGLSTDSVGYSMAYVIDLAKSEAKPICFFPTSGTWSLLPRIIFYMTLIFALVARTHEWLIGGALATALTYSSLSALQVMFQVWTHQAVGEMDIIAMTGILSCSCLMVVPLMNWSSTIRNLGLSEKDKDKGKRHGSAYTVLVLWGVLVAMGFLSAFAGLQSYFNGADWINIGLILDGSNGPQNVTCVPTSGYLNTSAGQDPGWRNFWMTGEFVSENNCRNPCSDVSQVNTLFRSAGELDLFNAITIDLLFERADVTSRRIKDLHFAQDYFQFILFALPIILLQGIMHICLFRRSSPQIARWKIYEWMAPIQQEQAHQAGSNIDKKKIWHKRIFIWRKKLAMISALAFYFFALFVLIIAPVGFVVTGVATEVASRFIKESETRNHVDQWGVFAATIMVLIAALICRFEPDLWEWYEERVRTKIKQRKGDCEQSNGAEDSSTQLFEKNNTQSNTQHSWHLLDELEYHGQIFYCMVAFEWYQLKEFWLYPRTEPLPRYDSSNKVIWVPIKPSEQGAKPQEGIPRGSGKDHRQGTREKIKQAFKALKNRTRESVLANHGNLPATQNASRIPNTLNTMDNHQRPRLVKHFSSTNSSYPLLAREEHQLSGIMDQSSQRNRNTSSIASMNKPLPVEPGIGRISTNVPKRTSNVPRNPGRPLVMSPPRSSYQRMNSNISDHASRTEIPSVQHSMENHGEDDLRLPLQGSE